VATKLNDRELLLGVPRKNRGKTVQDIVLLGVLADGPMHGYEVRKAIDEKLDPLVGIKPRSVYYSLDRLEKHGFLSSYSARSGKRPKKFVYELTRKGLKRLRELLIHNIVTPEKPYFDIDLSMYFFRHSNPEAFEKALKERLELLKAFAGRDCELFARERGIEIDKCVQMICEHDRTLLKQEIKFTNKLIECIKEEIA
jgi:DNA-binding PadR family transcriptional regulator